MGKDLKGKELGVGIYQRKDGLYSARITFKNGKRKEKYFKKLQECRKWLAEAEYQKDHGNIDVNGEMSVDVWFDYWIQEIKSYTVRPNTIRNYKERYTNNIKDKIGNMLLKDVRPMHCQNILNAMVENYRNSTIQQVRITLYGMFESAFENEMIPRNPVTKAVKCYIGKESKPKRVLTIDEQRIFLETALGCSNYNQYALILQTGLRTGELIGLKWSDIDFKRKIMHITRTMEYRHSVGEWKIGLPKSKSGYRDIPLTDEAIKILQNQKEKLKSIKIIPLEFSEYVFICRKGEPTKNSAYDTTLFKLAEKAGIEKFSMHTLRHTYATRCIEAGMRPKTLQKLLGHANIGITMNLYVHVTDEEKAKEVESIEKMLKLV